MNPREDAVSEFLMDLEVAMMRLSDRLKAIELHPSNQEPTIGQAIEAATQQYVDATILQLEFDAGKKRQQADKTLYPNANRPWAQSDDWQLLGMHHAGIEMQQIATTLGRPVEGVRRRLLRLEGK